MCSQLESLNCHSVATVLWPPQVPLRVVMAYPFDRSRIGFPVVALKPLYLNFGKQTPAIASIAYPRTGAVSGAESQLLFPSRCPAKYPQFYPYFVVPSEGSFELAVCPKYPSTHCNVFVRVTLGR